MSVKIGISPIAWQNDDLPDITADFTMEQALKEAREIGYTGVERGQRMPHDTEGLRAYLEANDLVLCGGWCSGNTLMNSVAEELNNDASELISAAMAPPSTTPLMPAGSSSLTITGKAVLGPPDRSSRPFSAIAKAIMPGTRNMNTGVIFR